MVGGAERPKGDWSNIRGCRGFAWFLGDQAEAYKRAVLRGGEFLQWLSPLG